MRSVGIKVLKNKLSEYVRIAASGEVVLVCERDRVVAELRAPEPTRGATVADAVLADLVRHGFLTPALQGPTSEAPVERRPIARLSEVLNGLEQDRSDR